MKQIDYSKYEGHTPGPWTLDDYDPYEIEDGSGHTSDACDVGWANEEKENWGDEFDGDPKRNAFLMCDAPTLLAACRERDEEIARLRELLMDAVPCSSLKGDARKAWLDDVDEACDAHRAALAETEEDT